MSLKNRVPVDVRETYRDTILDAENPRETARELAAELEINFGVMWEWVLREAAARAERTLPSSFLLQCVSRNASAFRSQKRTVNI